MEYQDCPGFGLDGRRRRLIYWAATDLGNEPEQIQAAVCAAVDRIGGPYAAKLRRAVLTRESIQSAAQADGAPISAQRLEALVGRVYVFLDRSLHAAFFAPVDYSAPGGTGTVQQFFGGSGRPQK